MNEATLEARLNGVLHALFPTVDKLRIKHQTTFVLQLGHREILIDGKVRDDARGRLDVLIEIDTTPIMLLELKAPDVAITADDRQQALSYARLLPTMPPLFAVSNGAVTEMYKTFDGQRYTPATVEEQAALVLISEAARAAADDRDAAVCDLLGRNPQLWKQIASHETAGAFANLTGEPSDFARPLCASFAVQRRAAFELQELIESNAPVVALVGSAISGKTNVLAQTCEMLKDKHPVLYVDASNVGHGLWQHIANLLAEHLLRATSANEARQWLSLSLRGDKRFRFILVVDALRPDDSDAMRNSLDELVRLTEQSAARLVIAVDEDYFNRLSHVRGRVTKTNFGRLVKAVPLRPLTDHEFAAALELLFEKFRLVFHTGAQYSPELREPRVLRLQLALAQEGRPQPPDPNRFATLSHFVTQSTLERVWTTFAPDPSVRVDLKELATAFLDQQRSPSLNSIVLFEQHRRAAISLEAALAAVSQTTVERLRNQGFLVAPYVREELLIMRVPELLAAAGGYTLATRLAVDSSSAAAYSRLIAESQRLPYGELAGALALVELSKSNVDRYNDLMRQLMEDPPTEEAVKPGAKLVVITSDAAIPLEIPDDADPNELGKTIGNMQPWLVLSHAAIGHVLALGHKISANTIIFCIIGNCRLLLRHMEMTPLEEMPRFLLHTLPDGTELPCHQNGIVEPLVFAMAQHMARAPNEMRALADEAIKANHQFLIWRLLLAAWDMKSVSDPKVAEPTQALLAACIEYWDNKFPPAVCCGC